MGRLCESCGASIDNSAGVCGVDRIVQSLRDVWFSLEQISFQKLAPTQLHPIIPGRSMLLVGPYSTYNKLRALFDGQLKISFRDKSPAEIDDLLKEIPQKH